MSTPEYCTCGAELPPEARFCHKCGRPLRAEDVARLDSEAAPAAPEQLVLTAPSFRNPVAVRIGLLAASLATLLNLLLVYGFVIWLVAAGFLSVFLFSRRTGQFLSVRAGARMGWITGILSFFIVTILFTISLVSIASRNGGLAGFYREQMGGMVTRDPNIEQAIRLLDTPGGQATLFVTSLLLLFTIITVFCTAGGALGAKVLEKD